MAAKKIFSFLLLILAVLVLTSSVAAIDESSGQSADVIPTKESSIMEKRKDAALDKMEEKREATKDKIEEERAAAKKRTEEKLRMSKEKFEAKRKEASESMKLKLATFRENLEKIKDEKKQALLERIQDKLTTLNKRRTDFMMSVLEKLNAILARLEEKVAKAKSENINTDLADRALTNAKTKISQAETAVSGQAGKTYVASVVTETTLRSTVGQTVNQLETDLRAVHKVVADAKQVLVNAAKEVTKLKKEVMTEEREVVTSPTPLLTVTETP